MRFKASGFTLIELMVTVAIIGIIAAVAYPSYSNSVMKSRRTDAKAKLLEVAQRQERYYTEKNTYTTSLTELNYSSGMLTSENGHYTISVAAGSEAGETIANSFILTATPVGNQANDTTCGNFTLKHTNQKGIGGTGTAANCW